MKALLQVGRTVALIGFWMLITACVTVNIYFPAAAAERAADQIIQDVWGAQPEAAPEGAPSQGNLLEGLPERGLALWEMMINLIVPPVQAQQLDIDVNTPAINRLKRDMAARHERLRPYYDSGAVGLTRDGQLAVRDLSPVPLPQRSTVNQLVAEENRDRLALYREIAVANGHPEWEDDIRATFARRWVANARPGWWYQDSAGNWRQK